jgi:hypothetical protein
MAMPFPGKLHGRFARDLLKETTAPSGICRAVSNAMMNALDKICWHRHSITEVELRAGIDAYDTSEIQHSWTCWLKAALAITSSVVQRRKLC